jgi:hypothetical protein
VTTDTKKGAHVQTKEEPFAKKLIFLKIEISTLRMAPIKLRKLKRHPTLHHFKKKSNIMSHIFKEGVDRFVMV